MRSFFLKRSPVLLLMSLFGVLPLFAQNVNSSDSSGVDKAYIEDYTEWLTTRLYLLYQQSSFSVNTDEADKIVFMPNLPVKIGIAGFYKWFGLGLSINNPIHLRSDDVYGKTRAIDLRVNGFGRSVACEVYFQNIRGFYIQNFRNNSGSRYIISGMNIFSMGGYGYWIYNSRKFSFRAAFIQNERQIRSAGSFIIRPGLTYYSLHSDTGIIPGEIQNEYHLHKWEIIKSGSFYSVSLSPGYSYTFVFLKNVYINAAVFPGVSWQNYFCRTKNGSLGNSSFTFQLGIRVAAGYNTNKWYIGGAVITGFNDLNFNWSSSYFFYDVSQFRIWGGLRFDIFRKKNRK